MSGFWLLLLLIAQTGAEGRAVKLTAAADLAGWVDSGAVSASLPSFSAGGLQDLFDGDEATFVLCGTQGAAVFEFTFKRPLALSQVGIRVGGAGVYRWRAERTGVGADARSVALFPWRHVEAGGHDPVALRDAAKTRSIRLYIERLTLGREIVLQEIECYTTLEITQLILDSCPERPRVGSPFLPSPIAIDRRGGRLHLTEGVAFKAYPKGMVKFDDQGLCTPLLPGKVQLTFTFASLTSRAEVRNIEPPGPPPAELTVVPFSTTASVAFRKSDDLCSAFVVYTRRDGEAPQPACITGASLCTVYGLEPDTAYYFSVAGLDERGHPITERTGEVRLKTRGRDGLYRCACIDLLVVIYKEDYDEAHVSSLISGFERAKIFIYRSSEARLALNIHYRTLAGRAPEIEGPDLTEMEVDLARRGVLLGNYGAVHVVSSNLDENCSGYTFHSGAIGSQGATASARWPSHASPVEHAACWTLVHEFQHTFDRMASANEEGPRMLSGHFLDNYPLPAGEVFDAGDFYCGQAETFRRFKGYFDMPGRWVHDLEAFDADNDGMPDDDARLPFDEERLGSDPALNDTDADGLDDRDEFCAGLYRGTDARVPDTDGDGILDGADPFPLSSFTGLIPRDTPRRGALPETRLSRGIYFTSSGTAPQLDIHASWDERYLYLAFVSDIPLEIEMHIDGSGHLGPFESDRTVSDGSDIYTADRALKLSFGDPLLFLGDEPVEGAQVLSAEKESGRVLWAAVPAALGSGTNRCHVREDAAPSKGLTLEEGRVVGLKFIIRPSASDSAWCTVYETHCFLDALLYR